MCVSFILFCGLCDLHISIHFGHLSWNLHPDGKLVGSGINPSIGFRRLVFLVKSGMDPKMPIVYG